MANLRRVEVVWTGALGLPGLSVFYTDEADDVTTNLQTFFTAVRPSFKSDITWTCASSGDIIDAESGTLVSGWSGGTAFSVQANSSDGAWAAGTGAFIRWGTNTVINGRRLRGRTFMTGVTTSSYDNQGTISSGTLTTIGNAATTLAATGKLVIWHRPHPGFTDGSFGEVTSATVPDQVTSLRSRRV